VQVDGCVDEDWTLVPSSPLIQLDGPMDFSTMIQVTADKLLKQMSDDQYICPILSAHKIGQQNCCLSCKNLPILSADKLDFIVKLEHVLFSTMKSTNFSAISHHGDFLQWEIDVYFTYLFCSLFFNVYFRSLDAKKNIAGIILRFPIRLLLLLLSGNYLSNFWSQFLLMFWLDGCLHADACFSQ